MELIGKRRLRVSGRIERKNALIRDLRATTVEAGVIVARVAGEVAKSTSDSRRKTVNERPQK